MGGNNMAKKYIDANRLKFKIKNRIEELDEQIVDISDSKAALKSEELLRVLDLINSLQQEQPEDLEEEIEKYLEPISCAFIRAQPFNSLERCARHFYELGLNAKED